MTRNLVILLIIFNEIRGVGVAWYAVKHGAISGHVSLFDASMLALLLVGMLATQKFKLGRKLA